MAKSETLFRRNVVIPFIRKNLKNTVVFSIQQVALNGDPDLILCCNSRFVALELKRLGKVPTPLQEQRLNLVRTKGRGLAYGVDPDSWPMVSEILRRIDKGEWPDDKEKQRTSRARQVPQSSNPQNELRQARKSKPSPRSGEA